MVLMGSMAAAKYHSGHLARVFWKWLETGEALAQKDFSLVTGSVVTAQFKV